VDEPAVVGVPEISPVVELMERPGGSKPDEMENVYGTVPPVTVGACE
jgi:hypothetical protein